MRFYAFGIGILFLTLVPPLPSESTRPPRIADPGSDGLRPVTFDAQQSATRHEGLLIQSLAALFGWAGVTLAVLLVDDSLSTRVKRGTTKHRRISAALGEGAVRPRVRATEAANQAGRASIARDSPQRFRPAASSALARFSTNQRF